MTLHDFRVFVLKLHHGFMVQGFFSSSYYLSYMVTPTRTVAILKQLPRPAMEAALAETFLPGHYLPLLLICQCFPFLKPLS